MKIKPKGKYSTYINKDTLQTTFNKTDEHYIESNVIIPKDQSIVDHIADNSHSLACFTSLTSPWIVLIVLLIHQYCSKVN